MFLSFIHHNKLILQYLTIILQIDNYRTFFKYGKKSPVPTVLPWQQNLYQLRFTLHVMCAKFHLILTSNNWVIAYLNI